MREAAFVLGVSLMGASLLAECAALRVRAVKVGWWQVVAGILWLVRCPKENDVQQRYEDRDDRNDEYDLVDGGHCSVFSWLSFSIVCVSHPSVVASHAGAGL